MSSMIFNPMMNKNKTTLNLLFEEFDSNALINLKGGASRNMGNSSSFPHDLVTPSAVQKPYTGGDPDPV